MRRRKGFAGWRHGAERDSRVFRRTQPYTQGHLRSIYCDTESYDDGLSGHLKAIHHQRRKLELL